MAESASKTTTKKTTVKAAADSVKAPKEKAAVAKKPAAAKTAAKKPAEAKSAAKSADAAKTVSAEQRYRMIAEAAYFRAQSHQFKSDSVRDWIEAEHEIDILLSGKK